MKTEYKLPPCNEVSLLVVKATSFIFLPFMMMGKVKKGCRYIMSLVSKQGVPIAGVACNLHTRLPFFNSTTGYLRPLANW